MSEDDATVVTAPLPPRIPPEAGYASSRFNASARPPRRIDEELKERFDVVVGMNEHRTAAKDASMATFGLGGCIGGYIDSPESRTFFHYSPTASAIIDGLVRRHVSAPSATVHFFVPGDWEKTPEGKWLQVPERQYTDDFLAPALRHISARGATCAFHFYSADQIAGPDDLVRYQNTAWVDKQGRVFCAGMASETAPQPQVPAPRR
jgi:hypothetical protein